MARALTGLAWSFRLSRAGQLAVLAVSMASFGLGCSQSSSGAPSDGSSGGDAGSVVPDAAAGEAGISGTPGMDVSLPEPPCNGWPELCARRYDEVAQPATHASMANLASVWQYPAQTATLRKQLDDSIRALFLEFHDDAGELRLCSVDCAYGSAAVSPALDSIRSFLEVNPREVVTLFVENEVATATLVGALTDAGLDAWAHAQDLTEPWPTFTELIDSGHRLLVFASVEAGGDAGAAGAGGAAGDSDAPAWLMPAWSFAWATSSELRSVDQMDCQPARGDPGAPLIVVNHFLVEELTQDGSAPYPAPSSDLAAEVNEDPLLLDRLRVCEVERARRPNFVAVDFYELGDVMEATQILNGLR